jgi:hypothetical protein
LGEIHGDLLEAEFERASSEVRPDPTSEFVRRPCVVIASTLDPVLHLIDAP